MLSTLMRQMLSGPRNLGSRSSGLGRLALLAAPLLALGATDSLQAAGGRPNLLLIVADDLGYGDLGCYGATKIQTPRIDQLSRDGVRFTDAHSVCAVCNPSRYSILSGTYLLHAKRPDDYSLYFHDGQITLPAVLKSAGYHTAALGKWHNGWGRGAAEPDWNKELKPGPIEIGFESFFGTPKTHNEPPEVFVQDHWVVGLDPADPIRMDLTKGPHGMMYGGANAQKVRPDERIDFIMAEKAAQFITSQKADTPFFLYLAFAAPHVPVNPAPEFRGKSQAGLYGDFVQQLDYCTGQVLDALEKSGLAENTLVIFTSDNGGVYHRDAIRGGHRCNAPLLGQKTDAWEGGHRVAMLARWPGHIPVSTQRRELFSQIDLMATLTEAAGATMPAGASPDGTSDLAAFTAPQTSPARRTEALFQGTGGFLLRSGPWAYLPKQGSGGMSVQPKNPIPWGLPYDQMGMFNDDVDGRGKILPTAAPTQLYNLETDLAEKHNAARENPTVVAALQLRLQEILRRDRK